MNRPLIIQTEHLDDVPAAWLGERAELVRCPSEDAAFPALLARADALVIRTYTRVDEKLLAGAPRLRVVGRAGVGLDNVDLPACRARGVRVVSTPDANTRAVVEFVACLILDAIRPRVRLDHAPTLADWKRSRAGLIAPAQLSGLILGVVGLGRVGSGVARMAAGFSMNVLYTDLLEFEPPRRFGAQPRMLDDLLRESDIISLHVDGRASNRGLISARELSLMKPGVLLVNTSRGFVLDAAALAAFLRTHPSARAALDVHEPEPFDAKYPLLGLPNCVLTPHIAAATAAAHRNMSWVVRDVWRVLSGEQPEHEAMVATQ